MAQTIALQRGTTTLTTNGTTTATLFTQSSGTATRVIVNNFGVSFTTTPNSSSIYIGLFVTSSGGQSTLLGWIQPSTRRRSFQFIPGNPTNSPFTYLNIAPTTSTFPTVPVISSNSNGGVMGASVSNVVFSSSSSTALEFNMLNSNFYIGPSDVIGVKIEAFVTSGKSVVATTANISYSFTTITES